MDGNTKTTTDEVRKDQVAAGDRAEGGDEGGEKMVRNQAVGSHVDHPAVDKDPSGDTLPHPSNRIDFNDPSFGLPRA